MPKVNPRGLPRPQHSATGIQMQATIAENADGWCGLCKTPLLRIWSHCPMCGCEVSWEPESPESAIAAEGDPKHA